MIRDDGLREWAGVDFDERVRTRTVVAGAAALDGQAHARAVTEIARRGQGGLHVGVAEPRHARELLGDDRPLGVALGVRGHVLPLAAAAGREVRAGGRRARGPGGEDRRDARAEVARAALDHVGRDAVAGGGVGHEHHLAAVVRERVEAEGEALDVEDERRLRHGPVRRGPQAVACRAWPRRYPAGGALQGRPWGRAREVC
jgi:hypothetical protein